MDALLDGVESYIEAAEQCTTGLEVSAKALVAQMWREAHGPGTVVITQDKRLIELQQRMVALSIRWAGASVLFYGAP